MTLRPPTSWVLLLSGIVLNACGGGSSSGPGPANQPPSASLNAAGPATVGVGFALSATAADSDGQVSTVAFFDGSLLIGEDSSAPYSLVWTPMTAGAHVLTARATDNTGSSTTSPPVTIEVNAAGNDTQAPVATLTSPAAGADELAGNLTLTAMASDNVGVTRVEFEIDGMPAGTDASAPYEAVVDTAAHASGQHVLRARARDAAGHVSPWSEAVVHFAGNREVPQGFTKADNWVAGLSNATALAQAPDGRLFVAQQGGAVRIVKNGVLLPTPFLQLSVDSAGERGLIGIALHPDFTTNGWVYLHYTTLQGAPHNRISRVTASGDVAVTGSEQVLMDLPPLSAATNHNGGALHFGADGKLYVGVGDNADGARAQDLSQTMGKLLRINDDGSIPADNPFFATHSGQARAIWAYGLRNPFTFAIQPGTGRLHINDVGQDTWEEINLGAPGANYGWPGSEGPDGLGAGITAPLFAYAHDDASPRGSGPGGFFTGFAIAGGTFYPDQGTFPAPYRGSYFFADFATRFVARLDLASNTASAFARVSGNPVDLLAGHDGALYILTRSGMTRIVATP